MEEKVINYVADGKVIYETGKISRKEQAELEKRLGQIAKKGIQKYRNSIGSQRN